jgi:hypothetical protein
MGRSNDDTQAGGPGLLVPESDALDADEIAALVALREAQSKGVAEPGISEQTALRLDALGCIRSKVVPGMVTGGYEITDQGLARLEKLRR